MCKIEKELKFFNKNKCQKDGLSTLCKDCNKQNSKRYYQQNIEHYREVIRIRSVKNIKKNQDKLLELLKKSKCADCGNSDSRVLEFDHVTGKKINNVGTMVGCGWSWESVEKEIKKCEIVCCNCHRIRTFTRKSNYRTK